MTMPLEPPHQGMAEGLGHGERVGDEGQHGGVEEEAGNVGMGASG